MAIPPYDHFIAALLRVLVEHPDGLKASDACERVADMVGVKRSDLDDFVKCFNTENRNKRRATWSEKKPEGRWRAYDYEELVARDKCSLDLFWLRDDSLLDADNLPDPDVIAEEIAEDLRAAVEQIEEILGDLQGATP